MSDRFSALKGNTANQPKKNRRHTHTTNSNVNKFRKQEKVKKKEPQIEFKSDKEFPELFPNATNATNADLEVDNLEKEKAGLSYIEKIKLFREENKVEEKLEKGWQFLTKQTKQTKQAKEAKEAKHNMENPYYNPELSLAILNNRYQYREEINELVGDISEYWNIDDSLDINDDLIDENWQREDDNNSEASDIDEYTNDHWKY